MIRNTYNRLEDALKEKGFWTPLDERRNMNVANIKDFEEAKEQAP